MRIELESTELTEEAPHDHLETVLRIPKRMEYVRDYPSILHYAVDGDRRYIFRRREIEIELDTETRFLSRSSSLKNPGNPPIEQLRRGLKDDGHSDFVDDYVDTLVSDERREKYIKRDE